MNLETNSYSLPIPIKRSTLAGFSIVHPPLPCELGGSFGSLWGTAPSATPLARHPPAPAPQWGSLSWRPRRAPNGVRAPSLQPLFLTPKEGTERVRLPRTAAQRLLRALAARTSPPKGILLQQERKGGAALARVEVPPQPRCPGPGPARGSGRDGGDGPARSGGRSQRHAGKAAAPALSGGLLERRGGIRREPPAPCGDSRKGRGTPGSGPRGFILRHPEGQRRKGGTAREEREQGTRKGGRAAEESGTGRESPGGG